MPRLQQILPLAAVALLVSGCDLIGDLIQFGFVMGIILVILVVAVIAWIVGKLRRG